MINKRVLLSFMTAQEAAINITFSGFNLSYYSEYTREDLINKPLFTIMNDDRMSRNRLSPLMAEGCIAQTLSKKPKPPLQRYKLLRKGKDVLT